MSTPTTHSPSICTSHDYKEHLKALKEAKKECFSSDSVPSISTQMHDKYMYHLKRCRQDKEGLEKLISSLEKKINNSNKNDESSVCEKEKNKARQKQRKEAEKNLDRFQEKLPEFEEDFEKVTNVYRETPEYKALKLKDSEERLKKFLGSPEYTEFKKTSRAQKKMPRKDREERLKESRVPADFKAAVDAYKCHAKACYTVYTNKTAEKEAIIKKYADMRKALKQERPRKTYETETNMDRARRHLIHGDLGHTHMNDEAVELAIVDEERRALVRRMGLMYQASVLQELYLIVQGEASALGLGKEISLGETRKFLRLDNLH